MKRRTDALFSFLFLVSDAAMIALAFYIAYWLRRLIAVPPPVNIAPLASMRR